MCLQNFDVFIFSIGLTLYCGFARHGKMIELKGPHCIYIPRFSPVETIYAPGWYTWRAYSCFMIQTPCFQRACGLGI